MTDEMGPQEAARRPRSVYAVGEETDPRFTFANERTFLAWIRTALALAAAGVAFAAFADVSTSAREVLSTVLIVAGGAISIVACRRWAAAEKALRLRQPLPGFVWGRVLTSGIVLAAGIALVAIFRS